MNVSIRWPIILGTILLVWGTHLIVAPYSYMMSERVLTRHASDIMQNISDLTLEQSFNHLNKAQSAAHLAKKLLSSDVFQNGEDGDESLERYFFDQLAVYPHLSGIYFGTQNGDFFFVSRNQTHVEGGFRTKIIRNDEDGRSCELLWRDANFTLLKKELDLKDTYDPRARPWFKKVMRHRKIVWTSPYIFFTSKQPGVTIAGPAFDDGGKLKGIVGVDIDIAELSAFIGRMRVGKSGRAFIINRNRDVIAFHDLTKLTIESQAGKAFRLAKVDELGDPFAKASFEAIDWALTGEGDFIINKPVSRHFELNGQRYLCMFTPFPEERLPWVIGVYVPENDYLGSLKDNRIFYALSSVLVTILASWVALVFAGRIINSVKNLQKEAKAIEENDLKSTFVTGSPFTELQETANSFTRMKKALIDFKARLSESEKLYRTITYSASDAIILLDDDQRIVYWNPAAASVFGWGEDEAVGRDIHEVVAPLQSRESFNAGLGQFMREGTGPFMGKVVEVRITNKAGRQLPVEISLARLDLGGKWYAAAIARDITERKYNEQMRKRLVRDLHDGIGGNLANIKLLSEMARQGDLPKSAQMAMDSISEVSDNSIAEIRNYMTVLDERSPDWRDVVEEIRQYCLKTLEPHGIALRVEQEIAANATSPSTMMYMNLFKIVREAVTNVIKHAGASSLKVEFNVDRDNLGCLIADDGKSTGSKTGSGRGLLSMESRAKEMGGSLDITYSDGMRIHLKAPLKYSDLA